MKSYRFYSQLGEAIRQLQVLPYSGEAMHALRILVRLRNELVTIMAPGVDIDVVLRDIESANGPTLEEEGFHGEKGPDIR